MAEDKKEKKLTLKEQLFITKYLVDFNATQAAIDAGYSKKTAFSIGCENLKKPYIQDAIKIKVDQLLKDNRMLALRVVRECEKIAFGKISDVLSFDDDGVTFQSSDDVDTATVESVSYDKSYTKGGVSEKKKLKRYSKEKALEILAKYTTLYTDAPKVDLNINVDEKAVADVLREYGINKPEPKD